MKRKLTITIAASAALLTSCATQNELNAMAHGGYAFKPSSIKATPDEVVNHGYWDKPAHVTGAPCIVIDTQLQQATYYIGNQIVGRSTISSGKAGHGTPRGTFRILAKDIDHKSSTYGSIVDEAGNVLVSDYKAGQPIPAGGRYQGAAMNYGMQITNTGIWMHEGLVTAAPESHGCIRLPREMAKTFFENTAVGTPVIIK
ncbi:MAG: L,D-transpeptidase family protein [Akkermansia sp.]|nr:L,D-transpeptidase family protein [Akkermansia sp.]MDO4752456.1 L,D-transpeptidase family protein [Akkermansia sp.]